MPSDQINDISSLDDKYTPTVWGQGNEFDFTCPSGQVCRLRKLDPIILISEGLLDKLDFLTSIVYSEHVPNAAKTAVQRAKDARAKVGTGSMTEDEKEKAKKDKAFEELMNNPQRMKEFTRTLDRVLIRAVIAPEILPVPEIFNIRTDGKIYADTIDFNDKMAIFNRSMKGVTDLEKFREDAIESVVAVASSPDVPKSTKRAPRRK